MVLPPHDRLPACDRKGEEEGGGSAVTGLGSGERLPAPVAEIPAMLDLARHHIPRLPIATSLATAPLPLVLACIGEVEYSEGDPSFGSCWLQRSLILAECRTLSEAIAIARTRVMAGDFETGSNDAPGFSPNIFTILDRDQCLALAGEARSGDIRWCDPVASDAEARMVVIQASRLRAEASFEAGADNHSAARNLRFRASVLEGRLVDPFWRAAARQALRETAHGQ